MTALPALSDIAEEYEFLDSEDRYRLLIELGRKLGPILWQFPPMMRCHLDLFEEFFAALPRTTAAAAKVALKRDARLQGRESLVPDANRRLRHCVEVRHESFVDPAFIRLLRKYNIAWVVAETPRPWPLFEDVTADFVYMRLHGSTELYNSRYTRKELEYWAECIRAWTRGRQPKKARLISEIAPPARASRDVYCYFDNTDKRHAPDNARELMAMLGVAWLSPPAGEDAAAAR